MSAVNIAQAAPSEIDEDDETGAPASGGGGAGRTVWSTKLAGFGLRTYPSGKQAYVVHTIMQGRLRMVTLGSPAKLSAYEAEKLAWQVVARAHIGANPAEDRKLARTAPEFQEFLEAYWQRAAPRWKTSTVRTGFTGAGTCKACSRARASRRSPTLTS